jgi:hypothetical protein
MPQEATKTEYAIAIAGLMYITAFTAAEQMVELGEFAYRRVRNVLGEPAAEEARAPRPRKQSAKG